MQLENTAALVCRVMSCVTRKVPNAPEPFACIRRSGMTSRSKCASFSRNHTSWSSMGPRAPAVRLFWLSGTGAPAAVVSPLWSVIDHSCLVTPGWWGERLCAQQCFLRSGVPVSQFDTGT